MAGRDLSDIYPVVMEMLSRGDARPHEISQVSGVSQQLISIWLNAAGLKWQERRTAAVGLTYAKRMLNRKRRCRESKTKAKVSPLRNMGNGDMPLRAPGSGALAGQAQEEG